jgi:hypothetical protein
LHGRDERFVRVMAQAYPVLIACDDDEGGKEAFTSFWSKRIPHAVRWLPWAHDINAMHLEGIDLQEWLSAGLALAKLASIAAAPPASSPQEQDELSAVCTVCRAEVERYSPTGIAYCEQHYTTQSDQMTPAMSYEQFMQTVQAIAAVFPGGCEMIPMTKGYRLAQHVDHIRLQRETVYRQAIRVRYG